MKIFGFEGTRQLWWAKLAAGLYIGSWVLIVGVSLLPRDDTTSASVSGNRPQGSLYRLLDIGAIVLHIGFLCYAMFEVNHMEGILE